MKVLIAGGGRTGAQLARFLISQNHDVTIVEDRKEVLSRIHRELPTEMIVEGNPISPQILEDAGIRSANVLAAVTTSDETNLVLCYIARKRYGVRRTIARVNNPRDAWLFTEQFHVDVAVNQSEILARLIEEEMSMGDMMTLLKLRRGNFSLVEEKVPPGARVIGVELRNMDLSHCVIAAIIRHGEMVMPRGVTTFEVGDEVLAVADPQGARMLADWLSPAEKA
ncbi:potassium channel family protein [Levilinea saccharolytica]|uniref:Trk system potassium uptake protein TrkA n=1 Tax=Levilinea saccharolytica TaxID=229921 RepID=A0A0P6Y1U6_9CHLR|nr:NAD-binding protein [Levilinea saccharolytica]KPL75568.1 potassium transporter TrkA [Levilinea saccharolytica]GAP17030.1 K+ transport systems, NAD-binding component [Levilinea saccharolytica]